MTTVVARAQPTAPDLPTRPRPVPPPAPRRRPMTPEERARMRAVYRRRRIVALAIVLGFLGFVGLVARAAYLLFRSAPATLVGLHAHQLGASAAAGPKLHVAPGSHVQLDGRPVSTRAATKERGRLVIALPAVGDGKHAIKVRLPRALATDASRTLRFTVDAVPPKLEVASVQPVELGQAAVVRGTADADAKVEALGKAVKLDKGRFSLDLPAPAPARVVITATDPVGNVTTVEAAVPAIEPETQAAHLTALAWVSDSLREPVLALLDAKKLNAIQLDIKDEGGEVGPKTSVALAHDIGAAKERFDLKKAVDTIHAKGGRVIGRIVTYRDPKLADASWGADHHERVVQTPSGGRYGPYGGGFLNPHDPVVVQYTTDLAVEAAKTGVDEILLDYVRRPDGPLESMSFSGVAADDREETTIEDTIVKNVGALHEAVRAAGARLGASVFGIAATRPEQIAQDIPRLSKELDYVAPMLYPSHWGKGELGLPDPNKAPGDTIERSMAQFQKAVEGSGAVVVPWLQDFSLGVSYGEKEVRAQVDAADRTGGKGFILWNAGCVYTMSALDPVKA